MKITMIAACSSNGVIGKDGKIPWKKPRDLQFFKDTTEGHPIIMGRKTFESLPNILSGRVHIVLTSKVSGFEGGIFYVNSIEESLEVAKKIDDEVFIIGGQTLYEQFMSMAYEILLTEVETVVEDGDAFFPEIPDSFKLMYQHYIPKEKLIFKKYERVSRNSRKK